MGIKKGDRIEVKGVVREVDTFPRDNPYVRIALHDWDNSGPWVRMDEVSLVSREEESLTDVYTRKWAELEVLIQEVLGLSKEIDDGLFDNFLENVLVDPQNEAEGWAYCRDDYTERIGLVLVDWKGMQEEMDEYRKRKLPGLLLR